MNFVLLGIAVAAVIFAATALVISVPGGRSPAQSRLLEISSGIASEETHFDVTSAIATLTRPLVPIRAWLKSFDEDLAYRLAMGGYRKPEAVDNFVSAKILCPVLGVVLATFFGRSNWALLTLLFGAAGFFAPDVFLIRAIAARSSRISQALPDFVDLLIICIDAGLGLDQSVLKCAHEMQGSCPDLSEELLIISREQRAGKPRLEAWRGMADRVNLDLIRQFVGMLTQSEKFGTPIARALEIFAESIRTKRLLKIEEVAAKTAVKLVFPLVFCIFPAMFVVLLGPAVLALMHVFD